MTLLSHYQHNIINNICKLSKIVINELYPTNFSIMLDVEDIHIGILDILSNNNIKHISVSSNYLWWKNNVKRFISVNNQRQYYSILYCDLESYSNDAVIDVPIPICELNGVRFVFPNFKSIRVISNRYEPLPQIPNVVITGYDPIENICFY